MKFTYDKLLYLDAEFISSKYEEIAKVSPATQFTKTEGMKAEGGVPFLKADIHTQETRTFTKSSVQMIKDIYKDLAEYPRFSEIGYEDNLKTRICWVSGMFTLGAWKKHDSNSEKEELRMFEIWAKGEPHPGHFSLVVQPENFKSNVEAFLTIDSVLTGGIGIEVTALVKVLFHAEKLSSHIACPYLIVEM